MTWLRCSSTHPAHPVTLRSWSNTSASASSKARRARRNAGKSTNLAEASAMLGPWVGLSGTSKSLEFMCFFVCFICVSYAFHMCFLEKYCTVTIVLKGWKKGWVPAMNHLDHSAVCTFPLARHIFRCFGNLQAVVKALAAASSEAHPASEWIASVRVHLHLRLISGLTFLGIFEVEICRDHT